VKFIIDNQLPLALAKWLQSRGEDAVHVIEREQAKADDRCIWSDAIRECRIVVSKDEDFVILASRRGDPDAFSGSESAIAGRTILSDGLKQAGIEF
jgi:predicted nuclease of predicted toxin-antitoxin system